MIYDIVVINGYIVDGTGNPWFKANVGIKDGKIVKVGVFNCLQTDRIIDATNLVVSPGFIDAHSHSDFALLVSPFAENKIRQGVTTEINGNCGISAAPAGDNMLQETLKKMIAPDVKVQWNWSSFGQYLDKLEKCQPAINVASLVGHSTIRAAVIGMKSRLATKEELQEMRSLVAQSMKDGTFGMSSGLAYAPGCSADTNELIELCKVVAKFGGVYATHARGLRETIVKSTREAIQIGEKAGLPVQISHHLPQFGAWGKCEETLKIIEKARARGVDVTCDLMVDTSGYTSISAIFPPWIKEAGFKKMIERSKDTGTRKRLKKEIKEFIGPGTSGFIRHNRWDMLKLIACKKNEDLRGKSFAEIAKLRGQDPFDIIFDLLLEEKADFIIGSGSYYSEEDIKMVLRHPTSMIGTDASVVTPSSKHAHPRSYGTFPRVLGRYVREEGVLRLEEAVRKMTSLPAQRFSLMDRGVIKEGMWADITIFDSRRIKNRATFQEYLEGKKYAKPYPTGIEYVLVNGQIVLDKGKPTKTCAGKVLRHSK